ncbi:hypothetical protein [Amycolatopsis sp. NPDC003731]
MTKKDPSAELADFWPNLKKLAEALPEKQQEFLSAVLWFAWLATAKEGAVERRITEAFSSEFDESFTPEQQELLVNYQSDSSAAFVVPRFIKASFIR